MFYYLRFLNYPDERAFLLPVGTTRIGADKKNCSIVIPNSPKGFSFKIRHELKNPKDVNSQHYFQIFATTESIRIVKAGLCETDGGAVFKPNCFMDIYPNDIIMISGGMQRLLLLESPRELTDHEQNHINLRELLLAIKEDSTTDLLPVIPEKIIAPVTAQSQPIIMSSTREMEKRYPCLKVPPLMAYFSGKCNRVANMTQPKIEVDTNNGVPAEISLEPPTKRVKEEANDNNSNNYQQPSSSSSSSVSQCPGRFCAAFERHFMSKIVEAEDADMSLNNFGYYLNENVKVQLISSAYVFLCKPESAKHIRGMESALWRSMILNGQSGTELYQEILGRALAKHFGARVLVLDNDDFMFMRRRVFKQRKKRRIRMRTLRSSFLRLREENEEVITANNLKACCYDGCDSMPPGYDMEEYNYDNDEENDDEDNENNCVDDDDDDNDDDDDLIIEDNESVGPYDDDDEYEYDYDYGDPDDDYDDDYDDDDEEEDDDDDDDDDDDPERSFNRYYGENYGDDDGDFDYDDDDYDEYDDDDDGNDNGPPFDLSRFANSSMKGPFGGRAPSINFVIVQPGKPTSQRIQKPSQSQQLQDQPPQPRAPLKRNDRVEYVQRDACLVAMGKSPAVGARGRIVLPFYEDDKAYGVEFDKPFPGGNDLGGMCKSGCGAFVAATSLALENLGAEIESSLVDALFAIAAQAKPLVIVVKDAINLLIRSRCAADRYERFLCLLERINKDQLPVILLGTSTTDLTSVYGPSINSNPVSAASSEDCIDLGTGSATISITGNAPINLSSIAGLMGGGGGSNNSSSGQNGFTSIASLIKSIAAAAGNIFKQYGEDSGRNGVGGNNSISTLFPRRIEVIKPNSDAELEDWAAAIKRDTEHARRLSNASSVMSLLERFRLTVEDVPSTTTASSQSVTRKALAKSLGVADPLFTARLLRPSEVGNILAWAAAEAIKNTAERDEQVNGKLQLRVSDLRHGAVVFSRSRPSKALEKLSEIVPDNEYEQRILADVISPGDINVSFSDIGALEDVKTALHETVTLPLQRPELFRRGNLAKPTRGILLFGPPGTGKTMLARAVATESEAAFISISMSSLTSKLYGDDEKLVRALFSVAHKLSPCVIFVDEVDSLLGTRESVVEHEMTRKIKNEFMAAWDGLRTNLVERVLVLAATNRPMDLDDAVLRRFSRRILVDLPDMDNREKILRVILKDEDLKNRDEFDFKGLARKTSGYSGNDLKNLCVYAAHQPVREVLQREKDEKMVRGEKSENDVNERVEKEVSLRPLVMTDFDAALAEVGKSVGGKEYVSTLEELHNWNRMYGDDGNANGANNLKYFI